MDFGHFHAPKKAKSEEGWRIFARHATRGNNDNHGKTIQTARPTHPTHPTHPSALTEGETEKEAGTYI